MSQNSEPNKRTLPEKKRFKKLRLKEVHFKILLLLSQFKNQNQISDVLKLSKSTVSEHIKRLRSKKLITKDRELTLKGKQFCSVFLRGYEVKGNEIFNIRSHDLCFRIPIVRLGSLIDKVKKSGSWVEVPVKNWVKYTRSFSDGVKVHITPKSILFYLPEILDISPESAYNKALSMVFEHLEIIKSNYPKIVLGKPEMVCSTISNHLAFQWDAFARLCAEHGITFKSDRLHVDHSGGVPELEAVNKDFARDDMRTIFDFYHMLIDGDFDKAQSLLKDKNITIIDVLQVIINRMEHYNKKLNEIAYFLGLRRRDEE